MIQARNLCKSYGARKAIDKVSFEAQKGEITGFLGPNGAGKTTTMKILTGCLTPDSGQASLAGTDMAASPLEAKEKIGYLPEIPPLYQDMYVEDFLKYAVLLKKRDRFSAGPRRAAVASLVESALKQAGLLSVRRRLIKNLSKGFKQRVGLAQALAPDPDILLLDEPTAGLDPRQTAEMRALLKNLKGRRTILLSTHILSEAQAVCDRVIIINHGKIIMEESLEGLNKKMSAKKQLLLKVRKPSPILIKKLKSLPHVKDVRFKDVSVKEAPAEDSKAEDIFTAENFRIDPERIKKIQNLPAFKDYRIKSVKLMIQDKDGVMKPLPEGGSAKNGRKANGQGAPSAKAHSARNFSWLELSCDGEVNEQAAKAVVSGGFGLLEMKESDFNLEDVFMRLTEERPESKERARDAGDDKQ